MNWNQARIIALLLTVATLAGCLFGGGPTYYSLEIHTSGAGSVTPDTNSYRRGTVVSLEPQPESGWYFHAWQGADASDVSEDNGVWTFVMDGDKELEAVFLRKTFSLAVQTSGQGTVHEEVLSTPQADLLYGTVVRLTAIPSDGWVFSRWEGDITGEDNPVDVAIEGESTLTAVFEQLLPARITLVGTERAFLPALGEEPLQLPYQTMVYDQFDQEMPDWPTVLNLRNPLAGVSLEEHTVIVTDLAQPGRVWLTATALDKQSVTETKAILLERRPPIPRTIVITDGPGEVEIPAIGESSVDHAFSATIYDQYGREMPEQSVSWELSDQPLGVSMAAHVLTVTDDALPATFAIEARSLQDDAISAMRTVELVRATPMPRSLIITGPPTIELPRVGTTDTATAYTAMISDQYDQPMDVTPHWSFAEATPGVSVDQGVVTVCEQASVGPFTLVATYGEVYGEKVVELTPPPHGQFSLTGQVTVSHTFPHHTATLPSSAQGRLRTVRVPMQPMFSHDTPEETILRFRPDVSAEERQDLLDRLGYEVLDTMEGLHAVLVRTHADATTAMVRALSLPEIIYAEPNSSVVALATRLPNDQHYIHQWHYPQIRLPQAWSVTTGARHIRIAVVDTGIDHRHPDLQGRVDAEYGYNALNNTRNAIDDNWHGTHVAGTIGAKTDNHDGIAGVMWEGTLVPIKVLNARGSGQLWQVAKGISYAAGLLEEMENPFPADVINLSLGTSSYSSMLADAVNEAAAAGVILVAASGNEGHSNLLYPARFPDVIAVGAVDYNYPHTPQRTHYSSYGNGLDIVAPGGDINVNSNNSDYVDGVASTAFDEDGEYIYTLAQGTSMAAPHVSGVIGLMLSVGIAPSQVRDILHRTSMRLGEWDYHREYGHGLINAYWAVSDVTEIRVFVGERQGNQIEAVAETTISHLYGGDFAFTDLPVGEYQVFAWIDVRGNNIIQSGDYLAASELQAFEDDIDYAIDVLVLEEIVD